jgi:CHAD domain-containing protein/energy-coupling factor transporter ATP-binding protein EcfA2
MASIEYRELTKRFADGTVAVDAFDLEIADGEFVVLVGPSGSGKTTVLRMTAGLEDPTAGEILIGRRAVAHRHRLRLVVQDRVGYDVIVGIRPEDIEDAALAASPNGSATLDVEVALAESTGAEVIAHFPVKAEGAVEQSRERRELAGRQAAPGETTLTTRQSTDAGGDGWAAPRFDRRIAPSLLRRQERTLDLVAGQAATMVRMDTAEAVRLRAYELSEGPESGTPEENWVRAEHELGAVCEYDTVERDLERSEMTVARFPLEAGVLWRLRLPRGESVEAWEPGNNGLAPPAEIASLIETVAAGRPLVPMPPLGDDPGARRLRDMLEEQRQSILRHDPGTRLSTDPENLHQHRVAARRVRAFVRATRAYTDAAWQHALVELLRALGTSTGPVRDFDVLLEHLGEELATLDAPDRAAGAALLARIRSERDTAQRELLGALGSDAYRQLLARLRVPPRLADGVEAVPLRRIAGKEFRRLLNAVEQLGRQPGDHELHRLRIKLKRARYASELAAPGKQGKRFLDDAKELQTLLGEHQDAVVAETTLREVVAGLDSAAAFVAGRLVERQRMRREQVKERLPDAWKRLRKSGRRLH